MPIPTRVSSDKPKTAKERIFLEVRDWIITGTLQPGEKISDQEISKYFSVSRTPVREAIQMLAEHRLVDIHPGRETRVSLVNFDESAPNYRIMAELHALILEFAYPHISTDVINELRDIDQAFTVAVKRRNVQDAAAFDRKFHDVLAKLAGNHFLTEFTSVLGSHIQRIENMFYQKNNFVAFNAHGDIIDALVQHDLTKAKEAMRQNWLRASENLKKVR